LRDELFTRSSRGADFAIFEQDARFSLDKTANLAPLDAFFAATVPETD